MCSLRLARVVDSHPEDHSVDIIMLDDHSRFVGVQVMTSAGAVDAGVAMPIKPGTPASGDKWDLASASPRDVKAVVAMMGRFPVVLGFLLPQINQMTFADGRAVTRYPSDVYVMCDAAGNFEISHPSGTFLRIGTPGHDNLAGKDFDGKWSITRNTSSTPSVQITVGAAGSQVASLKIDPSGNLTGTFNGTADITTTGNTTIHAPRIILDAPTVECTHNLSVDGVLTVANTAGGSSGAQITGTVTVTSGDVIADTISLKTHRHMDPQGGYVGVAVP